MRRIRSLTVLSAAVATGLTAFGVTTVAGSASGAPAALAARAHAGKHAKPVSALKTRTSSLGKIVVGKGGRTVYVYDVDHKGIKKSTCTGACRQAWPLVTFKGTARTRIKAPGVTGKVGSIRAGKGKRQVTLDGWPLYYFAGDGTAGQVNGQGVGGIWWAVNPKGKHLVTTPPTASKPPAKSPTKMPPTPPVSTDALGVASTGLGSIVVDGKGRSIYAYDADTQGTSMSACTGACLAAWPPVEVSGTPKVSGVTGKVGTITAPDGGKQVTLNGWPLYYYAGDGAPGDTNGQGVGGVWWALSPAGVKLTPPAPPTPPASEPILGVATTGLGSIVVDGKGLSVYAYDADTQGTSMSACTGSCLNAWPPVEVAAGVTPTATGVTGTMGTIAAPDGGKQVTLNGWPLYYYAGDGAPGDTEGQGIGGMWWVLSPSGMKLTPAPVGVGGDGW